jgi:predicted metal-binding protein
MLKRVSSNWGSAVLVCAKCSKKIDGGFGEKDKTRLVKALKKEIGKGRKAALGIVEVKCLGVCPKNAVTVIDSRKPGEWMVVRAGTPIAQVKALLTE